MTTYTKNQLIEICPAKVDKVSGRWAEFDGAEARVVELIGAGANQKIRVRLEGGEKTELFTLPIELLKPVEKD